VKFIDQHPGWSFLGWIIGVSVIASKLSYGLHLGENTTMVIWLGSIAAPFFVLDKIDEFRREQATRQAIQQATQREIQQLRERTAALELEKLERGRTDLT